MHRQLPSAGCTVASIACGAMWSNLWIVVIYLVIVVTEAHPDNTKKLYQNELQTDQSTRENRTNVNLVKDNTNELNSNLQQSTKSYKKLPAPVVDDDLLEFLVRVADNPAEWNKIRRVLSMLGRDETGTPTAAAAAADDSNHVGAAAIQTASSTSTPTPPPATTPTPAPPKIAATIADVIGYGRGLKHQPPPTPPTTSSPSWPSGDWIMKAVEDMKAAARARGIGAGGEDYDGDDDGNDYDYDDDEIEQIEEPTAAPPPPPPPPARPSRQPLLRTVAGHMSRYEFKRLDGRPDDGRVNGTYVAVIESDRPPRVVIYDPARQKKPRTDK
ncbi:uncharacterized protein LOC132927413 [Rhopalosiphum padi]|uniref:uncharacterized protein LOC132927413 n=1 Tax=Rhopalosiphum padi TaxID=40932 RepID=UPI00298EB3A7|nr:uncharacterized protein LOC132927413 [Rhopalosiphum padi]